MKILATLTLLAIQALFTWLFLSNHIGLAQFLSVAALWLAISLVIVFGPETISEITLWKASIRRDVQAARDVRDQIFAVKTELRGLTKLIVEDAYILASCSALAMGADANARERLEKNLDLLSKFAEPDSQDQELWRKDLESVFARRKFQAAATKPENPH